MLNRNIDLSKLSNNEVKDLENYKITNADGIIGIYDYINLNKDGKPTCKYANKKNVFFKPIKSVY